MSEQSAPFPRTVIGGVSVSRMIIGANWFKGYSHTSSAKDKMIREYQTCDNISATIQTFFTHGIDTLLIGAPDPLTIAAIRQAERLSGKKAIIIATPHFNILPGGDPQNDLDPVLKHCVDLGATFCFPHQGVIDRLIDPLHQTIRNYDVYAQRIREYGLIPGLSTHMPESILIADHMDADVAAYIQIYNAAGFMMHEDIASTHEIIQNSRHPVITIKPMAAGRLSPFEGLTFVWHSIRPQDMVAVGTLNPEEALELINISKPIFRTI